jgi:adenylate cyclase
MTRSISDNPALSAASQPTGARRRGGRKPAAHARTQTAFVTLRVKTILIVVATQLALLVILAAPLRVRWLANFSRLETQMLTTDVNRALNGIASEMQALDMMNASYAIWDDTYTFVDDRNQGYIDNNFYDQVFAENRLNLVLVVDSSGHVVFGEAFDLATRRAVPLPARFQQISGRDPLIASLTPTNSITGVLDLPLAPMMFASHAIVTSQGSGPIRGALVMGRYLSAAEIQRLAASTQIAFTIQRRPEPLPPNDLPAARPAFESGVPLLTQPFADNMIAASAPLNDLDRRDSLLLRVETVRSIYAEGQQGVAYFIAAFLIAGMLFGATLLILLERVVLARLTQLSASVARVGAHADLSLRVPANGNDELGQLADAFNQTLATLEAAEIERALLYREARENEQKYRAFFNAWIFDK